MSNIRVRIAPSPTGYFHIGTARTALFNWVFAKQHNGIFILRIEDTDKERSKKEFEDDIVYNLKWLGLTHDEFYRQSERGDLYESYITKLLSAGHAFYCAHTKEELEEEAKKQRENKQGQRHVCSQRDLAKTQGIIRFKNNAVDTIVVHDIIRGDVEFDPALLGDFSIAKSIKKPLYNFAVAIDDVELAISHVIRGEDHLPNTPKQLLIMQALGFSEPAWAHLPLLLGSDKSKLSKRHGAVSMTEYRKRGYTAEALKNFIVLLGWHPSDDVGEVLSMEKIIKVFSLKKVQKGGAVVEVGKLDWLNKEYISHISDEDFFKEASKYTQSTKLDAVALRNALKAARGRITVFSDIQNMLAEFEAFEEDYPTDLLLWNGKLKPEQTRINLDNILKVITSIDGQKFDENEVKEHLTPLLEKEGNGPILWPLRASLSGQKASFGPYELISILGKNEVERRMQLAINKLSA